MDVLLAIQNSIHTLARRMDQLSVGNTLKACEVYGIQVLFLLKCAVAESSSSQQVNAVYNQGMPSFNPYSNTYNEGWKHHPNFWYKNSNASSNLGVFKTGYRVDPVPKNRVPGFPDT